MSAASPDTAGVVRPSVHAIVSVMGTIVTIDGYGEPPATGTKVAALAQARALLHRADALFSTYKANSPISRHRRGELDEDDLPEEVRQVLSRCRELRSLTEGWFDPWRVPGGLDPSGYVKGWAAGRALGLLVPIAGGVIVNAAGDLAAHGAMPDGSPFRAGIVNPHDRRVLAAVVEVRGALATSGTAERGAHLFDPFASRPRARVASASVSGADLGTADALATAVAVGGSAALGIIEAIEGYEAMVIEHDGSTRQTDGFPRVR